VPKEDTQFNSKTGSKAGKKSKRPPSIMAAFNKMLLDPKNKVVTTESLADALHTHFLEGNSTAMKEILNRNDGVVKEETIVYDGGALEEKKKEMHDFITGQGKKKGKKK